MIFTSYNDIGLEEILSEYRRARLLIMALVVMLVIAVAKLLFLSDSITILPGSRIIFRVVLVWLSALTFFEGMVFIRIHWFHRRRLQLPFPFKLITSLIEITFPGILLWYFVVRHGNLVFLDSPLLPIYFLIIILSTLHLNPAISILVGLAGAVEYGWIIFEGFREAPATALPLLPQPAYYSRCVMLLLSGLVSGFVADQIRKRVNAFIRINELKRKVELSFGQQVSPEIALPDR